MAAISTRRLAINPYGDQYPDDDSTKEAVVEADGLVTATTGDRHVLLRWINGTDAVSTRPKVKIHSEESRTANTCYVLGQYTRAQRDQIVALAKAVRFHRKSYVNSCRTWTRDLLEAMVGADLLSRVKFDEIDADVPLFKRVPETSGNATQAVL